MRSSVDFFVFRRSADILHWSRKGVVLLLFIKLIRKYNFDSGRPVKDDLHLVKTNNFPSCTHNVYRRMYVWMTNIQRSTSWKHLLKIVIMRWIINAKGCFPRKVQLIAKWWKAKQSCRLAEEACLSGLSKLIFSLRASDWMCAHLNSTLSRQWRRYVKQRFQFSKWPSLNGLTLNTR